MKCYCILIHKRSFIKSTSHSEDQHPKHNIYKFFSADMNVFPVNLMTHFHYLIYQSFTHELTLQLLQKHFHVLSYLDSVPNSKKMLALFSMKMM